MIISFNCKETKKIFNGGFSRKFPPEIHRAAMRKLWIIDASVNINDLRIPPSNYLKKLKGKRSGYYSIRINNQWRICFKWFNRNAGNVEIIDYH